MAKVIDVTKYIDELIITAKLWGITVGTDTTEDFDMTTFGSFDATSRHITLYYEKELGMDAATLFTLAHELRHAYQFIIGMYQDYWRFAQGIGPKPSEEVRDAIEADADEYAIMYLKGRGIRVPKHLLPD